jgi:hypothetical protein
MMMMMMMVVVVVVVEVIKYSNPSRIQRDHAHAWSIL